MPKILLLEENQRLSGLIAKFLNKKGLDADTAPDGINAIRLFVGGSYDLLLANREVPFMSGEEVCRKIRESAKGKALPIIMMSGELKDEAGIGQLKQELALSGFLTKPFTSDALYSLISSSLAGNGGEATAARPDPAEKQMLPLKGSLERIPFEQVLFYLFRKRGTGTLAVSSGPLTRKFFFISGAVVEADVSAEDEDFGAFLSGRKIIEPVELREYRESRKRDGDDPRDIFVRMGCLTPVRFQEENGNFVRERLADCFGWRTGSILFEWAASAVKTFPPASVFMPLVFYHGFKTHLSPEALNSFLGEKGKRYVGRGGDFYEYQNHLAAEPGADGLLDEMDGLKTCAEIVASAGTDEAAVALYTLDYLKLLTWSTAPEPSAVVPGFTVRERDRRTHSIRKEETFEDLGQELSALSDEVAGLDPALLKPAPAPAAGGQSELEQDLKKEWKAIKDRSYYEIFGMTQKTFTFEKLKRSYFELTKKYGPQQFFSSSSDVMALAEELLSRISNAYETLSNVVSKENYDEMLTSKEQVPAAGDDREFYEQVQFQSGKVFVEQGQYASAEKAFMNCVSISPEKPEYLAYLALAIYHNPQNKGNPAAARRARELVNKSLQSGKLSIAYALKGTMYLDEGSLNFAEAEFNKALKINPNNKTALKKLEAIKAKREEEKKGLFQRMFK